MLFDFNAYILSYRQSEYYCYDLIDNELKIFALSPYFSRDMNLPRNQGGSCPLAYALKDLDGLYLTDDQKANFWQYTAEKTKGIEDFISNHNWLKSFGVKSVTGFSLFGCQTNKIYNNC